MPRSYLVTGGAGFIGSHLTDALLANGHRVVALDNFVSGKRENITQVRGDLTVIEGDVRLIGGFADEIPEVDAILHLAALISGYDSLETPEDYVDVNLGGLLRVIEFASERRVPRIVFASSSTVYGNQGASALNETTPPDPLTVYALTKLTGEHLLKLYGAMRGFSHCSLRLFNVYGPRQAPDHPYANVTCKFSHATANGLPVTLFGDGEQSRDFVYVDDVVRAFLAVLDGSREAIYNVGTGQGARIKDLIAALGAISGRPLEVERQPPWPNDIRSIRADTARFTGEFGFHPEVALSDGLARTVDFFREQSALVDD
ncbi:MAG TPA: NAD-dependent epimerase/dehydratase family protein [Sphingomicrobium sp.]|nr:NAD-dependent epimerase/dehydratase family protein [Sphingomicrobium sp.]